MKKKHLHTFHLSYPHSCFPSFSPRNVCTACCVDQYLNYDETATQLNNGSYYKLTCTNCGSTLTALASFVNLAYMTSTAGVTVGLEVSCSNCTALTSFGLFPDMVNTLGAGTVTGASTSIVFTCTDCPVLTSFGSFAGLNVMATSSTSSSLAQGSISLTCTNCPALSILGSFPDLTTLSSYDHDAATISLNCNNCGTSTSPPSAWQMGYFPVLDSISYRSNVPTSGSSYLPSAELSMQCSQCYGLTDLGSLGLYSIGLYNGTGQLSVVCYTCPDLLTMGLLNHLDEIMYGDVLGPLASGVSYYCSDCPSLVSLGEFNALTYLAVMEVNPSAPLAPVRASLELSCSQCDSLTTLGSFPQLISLGYYHGSGSLDLWCSECAALPQLAVFGSTFNYLGNTFADFPEYPNALSAECDYCGSLGSLGVFPNVYYLAYLDSQVTVDLYCTDCTALVEMGVFDAMTLFMSQYSTCTTYNSVYMSCSGCGNLTNVASFQSLNEIAYDACPLQIEVDCTDCPALLSMGNYDSLFYLVTNDAASVSSGVTLTLTCTNCDAIEQFISMPNMGTMVQLSNQAVTTVDVVLTCSNCSSLTSFGTFTSLVSPYTDNTDSPSPAFSPSADLAWLMQCINCSSFVGMETASFPALDASSTYLDVFTLECNNCGGSGYDSDDIIYDTTQPAFNASVPITYQFDYYLPVFGSIVNGAGFIFNKIGNPPANGGHISRKRSASSSSSPDPAVALAAFTSVVRLNLLQIDDFGGLTDLDMMRSLERVDNQLEISGCNNLTNVDGLTITLQYAGSVSITANPVLCNIFANVFLLHSQTNPVLADNGYATDCVVPVPVAPSSIDVTQLTDSLVALTWDTSIVQPSIATVLTLTMNGIPILTYPTYSPPALPLTISPLSADTRYGFIVTASLNGGQQVLSPQLTITTLPLPSTVCPAGSLGVVPNCTACPAGSYVAPDGGHCALCVAGTFSPASSTSSAACTPCAETTVASTPGQSSCGACPADHYCPYGSASALQSAPVAVSPTANNHTTTTTASAADDTSGSGSNGPFAVLNMGYILLIVFGVGVMLVTILAAIARKQLRRVVVKFSAVMRTPRWMMRADQARGGMLEETPSFVRGLIGVWVLLGVVLVTIYQIDNFVQHRYDTSTSLQPGTTFTNRALITTAVTQLNVTAVLMASPVHCNDDTFTFQATLASVALPSPVVCTESADGTAVTLGFGTLPNTQLQLSSSSIAELSLTITAADSNVVFAPVLSYALALAQYDGSVLSINETIVPEGSAVISGASTVTIAGVAVEHLTIDGVMTKAGYTFSYLSTVAAEPSLPSPALVLTFQITVPSYYMLEQQVEVISVLMFLSGILAIGGGVVTVGTLVAFAQSYYHVHNQGAFDVEAEEKNSIPMQETPESASKDIVIYGSTDI